MNTNSNGQWSSFFTLPVDPDKELYATLLRSFLILCYDQRKIIKTIIAAKYKYYFLCTFHYALVPHNPFERPRSSMYLENCLLYSPPSKIT